MIPKQLFCLLLLACLWAYPGTLPAQDAATRSFSLNQAIEFALQNNVNVKNAEIDIASAAARVGDIRSIGLPQINAQAQIIHNIEIQKVILENGAGPFNNPEQPLGAVQAFPFQLKNLGGVTFNANQLIFSGSYFIGLQAAKTYRELSQKALTQSKINTAEAVTKAYYSVLVNRERLGLLDVNVARLDSLFRETQAMNQTGFVEKIDVDRIEVQRNNLATEKQNVERLVALSESLLKFQMGLPLTESVVLTDNLDDTALENYVTATNGQFDYGQRVEYSLLQTQRELASLDVRNNRSGYLPTLAAFGTFGYNPAASRFSNLFDFKERWFQYSLVGLQLNVPIFDGLQKYYKIQQAKLTYQKTVQSGQLLQNSIDLEISQATTTLTNALASLKNQRRNLELAQEVVRVTRIKYQEGVGSNLEVINAEADFKAAQTNYYSALYDAYIAKVDYDKATGTLVK